MFSDGYVVLPGMITVTPALLRKLNLRMKSRAAGFIFNGTIDNPRNDNRRRQASIRICDRDVPGMKTLHDLLDIPEDVGKSWNVLKSMRGCKAQGAHMDYAIDPNTINDPLAPVSHGCLIAVQDGTTLDVWRGAHRHLQPLDVTERITRIKRTTLELSIGDAVVFRADCVHAGSAYSQNNIRLHCYLDIPSMLHSKNRVTHLNDMSSTVVLENK